jgi:hypothetical protein
MESPAGREGANNRGSIGSVTLIGRRRLGAGAPVYRRLDCSLRRATREAKVLSRVAAFLAAGFEQEPGAALGFVDEGL